MASLSSLARVTLRWVEALSQNPSLALLNTFSNRKSGHCSPPDGGTAFGDHADQNVDLPPKKGQEPCIYLQAKMLESGHSVQIVSSILNVANASSTAPQALL